MLNDILSGSESAFWEENLEQSDVSDFGVLNTVVWNYWKKKLLPYPMLNFMPYYFIPTLPWRQFYNLSS